MDWSLFQRFRIQLFLNRAAPSRPRGQLQSAVADVHHVISRYPIHHDSSACSSTAEPISSNLEGGYAVDDSPRLRAFDMEAGRGLAWRPEVRDTHAKALANVNAKKKEGGNRTTLSTNVSHRPSASYLSAKPTEKPCKLNESELEVALSWIDHTSPARANLQ
jgi:hypothetical protein